MGLWNPDFPLRSLDPDQSPRNASWVGKMEICNSLKHDCISLQSTSSSTKRAKIGDILECRGSLSMENNTFSVQSSRDEIALFSYRAESSGSFLASSDVRFICPRGYTATSVYRLG